MSAGIILKADNPVAHSKARKLGVEVAIAPGWELPWPHVLFLSPGIRTVPWALLSAGFRFLKRWDAAAPLVGALAAETGTPAERKRTEAVTHDLRILVYEPGLLFVRDSPAGRALVETWRAECADGGDERLAFLRALHIVKPHFCVLPRSWLADEQARAQADARAHRSVMVSLPQVLVKVELSPGRFVKCRPGEEEKVKRHYQTLMQRRAEKHR